MSLSRLILWRHGETEYNVAGRMQGHIDSALTEVGVRQAEFAAAALTRFRPELIIASDLRRARDTAAALGEAIGVSVRLDKRLRETHLGDWQGLTSAEVDEGWPGQRARWGQDATSTPPGGESRVDVAERAAEVVDDLLRAGSDCGETVLLAAHGGVITALTARLAGFAVESWPALGGIDNCHWVQLTRRDDRWRLRVYNAGMTG